MPQLVVDEKGKTVSVIISIREYKRLLRDSEELESIKAYDKAKECGGKAIPFEDAIKKIERNQSV